MDLAVVRTRGLVAIPRAARGGARGSGERGPLPDARWPRAEPRRSRPRVSGSADPRRGRRGRRGGVEGRGAVERDRHEPRALPRHRPDPPADRALGDRDHRGSPMMPDELVARYLDRLGVTARGLADLHLAHLIAVPFENLSIHANERIHLDVDWLFDKLVTRRRGGFCYELNGLFAELLRALGHRVDLLAARVVGSGGTLGIPFDHMCLRVDDVWLADVGFGDSFITPLRLDTQEVQHDGRRGFRIVEDGGARVVEDSGRRVYVFEL